MMKERVGREQQVHRCCLLWLVVCDLVTMTAAVAGCGLDDRHAPRIAGYCCH
jgi:hypothetical protein